MRINTDSEIDAKRAKALREQMNLTQREFWGAVGVSQPGGSQYERGARPIPSSVRKQIFFRFVAGLNFDTGTVPGAQALCDFAARAASTQGK